MPPISSDTQSHTGAGTIVPAPVVNFANESSVQMVFLTYGGYLRVTPRFDIILT